ncbi:hypothetical protein M885DRAFT_61858 [Pelagophyceae sp. CCMP2097]|nr:hypothetical protein M885DRAFT_61858 [Pelagophyceae sp. CCMP2097]
MRPRGRLEALALLSSGALFGALAASFHASRGVRTDAGRAHVSQLLSKRFDFTKVDRLLVVPGGGPGRDGLPLWTRQRCDSMLRAYSALTKDQRAKTAVLLLSAGSMNAPSPRDASGAILFESVAMARYVSTAPVSPPAAAVLCDTASWDTVGNAVAARSVVDALLWLNRGPLSIEIHVSDFHADRTQAAMLWALEAAPAVDVRLSVVAVSSKGLEWTESDREMRAAHERQATLDMAANQEAMPSHKALKAFIDLQAHQGSFRFTHEVYAPSRGAGWG